MQLDGLAGVTSMAMELDKGRGRAKRRREHPRRAMPRAPMIERVIHRVAGHPGRDKAEFAHQKIPQGWGDLCAASVMSAS